jgi:hypothetical protein
MDANPVSETFVFCSEYEAMDKVQKPVRLTDVVSEWNCISSGECLCLDL